MTCKNLLCNYQFCWICEKEFTSNHYTNIFSFCFRLNLTNQNSCISKHNWLIYPRYFCLIILFIILIPILLILIALFIILFPFIVSFISTRPKTLDRLIKIKKYKTEIQFLFIAFFQFMTIFLYPLYFYSIPLIISCLLLTLFHSFTINHDHW